MKRVKNIIYTTLAATLMIGCSAEQNFCDADFGEPIPLVAERQELNIPTKPKDVWGVADSLLLVVNRAERDSMYLVVSPATWQVKSLISGQKGDSKLIKSSDRIMVHDPITAAISTINTQGDIIRVSRQIPTEDIPQNIFYENSTYIYDNYDMASLGRSLVMLKNGERVELSKPLRQQEKATNTHITQGFAGINPATGAVVYAYEYLHRFDIYSAEGELLSINKNGSQQGDISHNKRGYKGVAVTADRVYLHHVGDNSYIESFDWQGVAKNRYILDGEPAAFTIVDGTFIAISEGYITYKIK